ncbi:MAG: hypothetical protein NTV34_12755 [Proteobacteria bacterium]|nr:hypothetical protein [Pseudomonadota bacterium]
MNKPIIAVMAFMTFLIAIASCGQPEWRSEESRPKSTDQEINIVDTVIPPKEYYDALLADRMASHDQSLVKGDQILYINFNGATVKKGYTKGTSFIPCVNQVTIPQSGLSTADQKAIAEKVARYYSNAAAKLLLTYSAPASGDFTTLHIGGRYSDLGCLGGGSTLGVAPFDVGNANPNDTGFVFIPTDRDLTTIAQTIAHEAAHSFGLDHTDNQKDLMFPVVSAKVIGFDKGIAQSSRATQDGPKLLQDTLGSGVASVTGTQIQPSVPVTPIPNVTPSIPNLPHIPGLPNINKIPGLNNLGNMSQLLGQLSPALIGMLTGKIPQIGNLPGGVVLQNPASILSLLTILQNATSKQNGGTFDIQKMVALISSPQFSQLSQILSIVGLVGGSPTAAIAQLAPMLIQTIAGGTVGGTVGGGTAVTPGAAPLNFSALLGLGSITNPGQLIALIPQYSQIIGANFSGPQAQSMMDLVKLAIAAQYKSI